MKFVCLGYLDEELWNSMTADEQSATMAECFDYDDQLRLGRHFTGGEALGPSASSVTLRRRGNQVEVSDGPYAETKEVLGGILFLEARDLNQAISLISQHPGLKAGPFEIRPADAEINNLIADRDASFASQATSEPNSDWPSPVDGLPAAVDYQQWEQCLEELHHLEKELTRAKDALSARRRRLPMVKIEKDDRFTGPSGDVPFIELFEGRRQLAVYHFMFAEGVGGWPNAGCVGCSLLVDNIGHPSHFHARDLSLALVSIAPFEQLRSYQRRMGWKFPWYSSARSSFNADMGASLPTGETHGLSVFMRLGNDIYLTYRCGERGVESLLSNFTLLDLAPLGRQEKWEDSPPGWPQSDPYVWWRRHDEYEPQLTSISPPQS